MGHDETFFIESDGPEGPFVNAHNVARMMARDRQELIANELTRLVGEEYLEDIMEHMTHMEACSQLHNSHLTFANLPRRRRYPMPISSTCSARFNGS